MAKHGGSFPGPPANYEISRGQVIVRSLGDWRNLLKANLSNAFIEKALGVRATTRNLETAEKLLEMAEEE